MLVTSLAPRRDSAGARRRAAAERDRLVELARRKPVPPYTLDEELTFFCPQENLEALDLPVVRKFHDWVLAEHEPPSGDERAVLVLLPCQKVKPYTLSPEHRAVNGALLAAGYEPDGRGDWPAELAEHLGAPLLSNAPLRGHGLRVDRAVMSEPFGVVPYEAIYHWRGELSPCARYDDPGLFEHRGLGCPWRADSTTTRHGEAWRWGDSERRAYVATHNRLSELMGRELARLAESYEAVLAYVAPGLTHRSFLADPAEREAAGLRKHRRVTGESLELHGVGEAHPGLVELVPDGARLARMRSEHGGRLPADVLQRPWCLEALLARIARVAG